MRHVFLTTLIFWHLLGNALAGPARESQYVALGSSFAAGPGVGDRELGSPLPCRRSDENYAHLYAKAHKLSLADQTCSGATTKDILEGGQFGLGPQIDAVGAQTKLVTVTIGGNDVSYLRNLYAKACGHDPSVMPDFLKSGPFCKAVPDTDVDHSFNSLDEQLRRIATVVKQRAPKARLIFVNYFTILPPSGTCAALKITASEADRARLVARRLADVTRSAARESDAMLLDAAALSRSHDICGRDPWMQPLAFPNQAAGFGPFGFHPTKAAMQAVADHMDDR